MEGLKMKYFVLNPNKQDEYGKASREAIKTYASFIAETNVKLSAELFLWIEDLENQLKDK